jgi:ATP-dependent DNA ligase
MSVKQQDAQMSAKKKTSAHGERMLRRSKIRSPLHPAHHRGHPERRGWLHEPKLDGYRLQVVKDGTALRLYSRSGYDWPKRLAVLADALAAICCQSAVIVFTHQQRPPGLPWPTSGHR